MLHAGFLARRALGGGTGSRRSRRSLCEQRYTSQRHSHCHTDNCVFHCLFPLEARVLLASVSIDDCNDEPRVNALLIPFHPQETRTRYEFVPFHPLRYRYRAATVMER